MQYVDDPEVLLLVLGLLVAPMLFAFPAQHYWRKRILPGKKHRKYRKMVAGVLNHGHPLELFRPSLDKAGRRWDLSIEEQGRIESDILYHLRLPHFLLLPSMILWPVLSVVAVILILPLLPLLRLTEWVLIDKGGLTGIVRTIKRLTEWQLIGVPKLDRGAHGGGCMDQGAAPDAYHGFPRLVRLSGRALPASSGCTRAGSRRWDLPCSRLPGDHHFCSHRQCIGVR